jgi:hypothetical protein
VLKIATRQALEHLRRAAVGSDVDLDTALLRLGVLAPLDLDPIRQWVQTPNARLDALTNRDGHRVIAVVCQGETAAWIHHDGEVVTPSALAHVVA